MKKTKMLVLVIGALFLFSMLFSPLIATSFAEDDGEDDDDVDDSFEDMNHREISVTYLANGIEIESELETGNREDEIEVTLLTEPAGLELELEYNSDIDSLEVELELEVTFYSLIEYVDTNADGIYNESVDTFIGETILNSFQPITYTTQTTPSGNTLHIISATSTDGVFTAKLYAAEEFEVINNSTITPTEVKIDIEIHNYVFVDGGSDLALKVKLTTSTEYEYEVDDETEDEAEGYAENEMEVETKGSAYTGFFSWATVALVDGIEQEVKASPLSDDSGSEKMYLNYPRGTDIIHDPKMGVQGLLRYPFAWTVLIVLGSAIAAVVIISAFFLRRKASA